MTNPERGLTYQTVMARSGILALALLAAASASASPLTEAEKAKWAEVLIQLGQRLSQGTFSPDLMKRLIELAK